jgi:hypothetical protein
MDEEITISTPPLPGKHWRVLGQGVTDKHPWAEQSPPWIALYTGKWIPGNVACDIGSIYAIDTEHPDAKKHKDYILATWPNFKWPEPSLWGSEEVAKAIKLLHLKVVYYTMDRNGRCFGHEKTPYTDYEEWLNDGYYYRFKSLDNKCPHNWEKSLVILDGGTS